MKSLFFKVSRKRVAACLIGAAAVSALSIGVSAAFATPAGQCPRGQFFWKSKKSCIDKAEAAKLGLYHGPIPAAASARKATAESAPAPVETSSEAPTETSAAEKAAVEPAAPPQQASATLPPVFVPPPPGSLGPAAEPAAAPASQAIDATSGPSPYGELVIEEFAKAPEGNGPISN